MTVRDCQLIYHAAAVLLRYPDRDVVAQLDRIAGAVRTLPRGPRELLLQAADRLRQASPRERAEEYVIAFNPHPVPVDRGGSSLDGLPAMLKAAATRPSTARLLLAPRQEELRAMSERLHAAGSSYADVLDAIRMTLPAPPQPRRALELVRAP